MAMQVGIGLSRILLLTGAGRLSDILEELQGFVKGLEKSPEESGADLDIGDALTLQVCRLAMEVRQLASACPITVLSGSGQAGNMTNVLVPAAAVGAVSYGYMRWKGLFFADFMYVTKKNMANAVSSMKKQLDQMSTALASFLLEKDGQGLSYVVALSKFDIITFYQAKRHLTERIVSLDGKLDEQKVLSAEIKNKASDVRGKISNVSYESLRGLIWVLKGKIRSLEDKQNFTCAGVSYLCEFVVDKDKTMPDFFEGCPQTKVPLPRT